MQRLIVGCGKHYVREKEGDVSLDVIKFPCVDVTHDLDLAPYPFKDNMFIHVSAIHVVEHLRSLLLFMNEVWRIIDKGGSLYIETPCAGMNPDLEFADPTHIRCYRPHSFINYFTPEGIESFGYTDKAWSIYKVAVENDVLIFHGSPIK